MFYEIDSRGINYKNTGVGKTMYLLSASFRDGNVNIWQAILT
jgi:hypothetical protein